jgi:hypothetical protein
MSNVVSGHVLGLTKYNADDFSAKTVDGPVRPEAIEEMEKALTKVIEDFDRAVNVEALRLAKETGERVLSQSGESILICFVQNNSFCLSVSNLSKPGPAIIWNAAVWKAPDNPPLIESGPGWTTHRRRMMDHGATPTGATAHLESGKRRWLIRSVQTFMIKSSLLERFSAGETTRT